MRLLKVEELSVVAGAETLSCPAPPPPPSCPAPQEYLERAAREEFADQFKTGSTGTTVATGVKG